LLDEECADLIDGRRSARDLITTALSRVSDRQWQIRRFIRASDGTCSSTAAMRLTIPSKTKGWAISGFQDKTHAGIEFGKR
jgi:hypothetical protein